MNTGSADGNRELLAHVLLPVATEADARATARALAPYAIGQVTVLHVVEKGGGVPDKTPVEQSEAIAAAAFEAVRETFPEADGETAYGRDVADAIFETADAVGASAIAYRSRGGGLLSQLLSGDLTRRLVTEAELPVIALPRDGENETADRDTLEDGDGPTDGDRA